MSNSGLANLDAVIHAACAAAGIADSGTYFARTAEPAAPGTPCRVYVNRAMQQMGDVGPMSGPRVLVEILRADIATPEQYGEVVVGTERWRLESEEAGSDESVSRWVVGHVS